MAKKGGSTALQTEVSTDHEWNQVLGRKGLVVVDVFSDWAGPCVAMVSTLRKIKMELGGDALSYAVAKNDDIDDLARFRGKCEPVWMFVQDGMMVNLMFGAHCPNLQRLLVEEIRRVQQAEPPKYSIAVTQRGPLEEARWQLAESVRLSLEAAKKAKEDAEKTGKYEAFLSQMMLELCEETALLLYPWVFKDDEGNPREKDQCPPYAELIADLFPECFDVVEESRLQLTPELIEKLFAESNVDITESLVRGLTDGGKCMVMRLKGKPPHPDWPVPYPNEIPLEPVGLVPVRTIDDVENYLLNMIYDKPPPLLPRGPGQMMLARMEYDEPYYARHSYVREPDPEDEEETERSVYPAVWVPPRARSKVHVFKTVFGMYMDANHPYEEPIVPPPLNGFKLEASKLVAVSEAYNNFSDAIEYFGVFEFDKPPFGRRIAATPEDFENKVKYKTGYEVFVVILRRINDQAFLSFAGIEPYFVTEDDDEAVRMIEDYFPEGARDVVFEEVRDDEEEAEEDEEDRDEDEEEDEEEEEEEEDEFVDFSAF